MKLNNIIISTECVADLPLELYINNDVDIIYYDIKTETGLFRDTAEIDSQNVMDYMVGGHKKAFSVVPTGNDYKNFFSKELVDYDYVIHICISSGISEAYNNAMLARAKMGKDGNKVFIVDSKHLSSGQGLLALEAVKCRDKGMQCKEIIAHLNDIIPRISTSFLAYNANYLYYNGKVEKYVMELCKILRLHPVLAMIDGKLSVKKVYIGDYDKAMRKYIKNVIGDIEAVDKQTGFITYAGCSSEMIENIKNRLNSILTFENLYIQQASATVSCNCGPKTFGVLFIRNKEG